MSKTMKRLMSMAMAMLMVLLMLPFGALAENWESDLDAPASTDLSFLNYSYGTGSLIQVKTNLPAYTPVANFLASDNGCQIDQSANQYQQAGWFGMAKDEAGNIYLSFNFNAAFEAGQTYVLPAGAVFGFTNGDKYALDKNYTFTFDGASWTMVAQESEITLAYRYGTSNLIQYNTNLPSETPLANFLASENGCALIQNGQQVGWIGMDNVDGTIVLTFHFNAEFAVGDSYTLEANSLFGFTDGEMYALYEDVTYYWDGANWSTEPVPGTSEDSALDLTSDLLYEGDLEATVTVPAGKTYYFIAYRVGGMVMSINGGEGIACTTTGMWYPYAWTITNDSDADAEYVITLAYPEGSMDNPAVAQLGDNYCSVNANSQGYFLTYIAEETGDLIITISGADQWTYVVNNLTTYVYGDTQWSDSDPVVNPTVMEVNAGDEIQIVVNGYDASNPWENPAADLVVTLEYAVNVPELPTATVVEIENDDLTVALNFKADDATDAQLAYYGNWYADFVLTVNKDVTFNANGGADGYLSGQYDAWSENWVSVPTSDTILEAGDSLQIMAYASKLMGKPGLKYTYADVYSSVKDFDCGLFFEKAYLKANPDLVVTLELRIYNPADETESYVIGSTHTFTFEAEIPELPTATVTEIEQDDLTFAMNFKADEATEEQLNYYGDWYADFVLTANKTITYNANGGANGYLSGQYDAWSSSWVDVPAKDVTIEANESVRIMAFAADLMGKKGLKYTYAEVYESVKDFDCGVYFEDAFLAANPDLVVTLELRVYNPADESENYVIGETYTFTVPQDAPIVDPDLGFYTIGLSFAEYIGIQPMVMNSAVKDYDSFYVEVGNILHYGVESYIIEPTVSNKTYNVYDLKMLPRYMTDEVMFTIYAMKDGIVYRSEPVITSITDLALDKIASYEAKDDIAACTVLVDMLNYGTEVQMAFNYKTTDVPNTYVGEYAKYASDSNVTYGGDVLVEGSGVKVYANSVSLGSMVEVQFMFKASAVEGCELRYTLNGETFTVDASEFDTTSVSGYAVAIFAVKPRNFRDTMTMALYNSESGEAVSATYTASVADYASSVREDYPTLIPAILNYGDAVLARFPG